MPAKTREYYLTTTSSRDFTWFFFRPPAAARPLKKKTEPSPAYRVSKARRGKVPSTKEGQRQALMAPADVKAMAAARARSEPAKPKPKLKKIAPKPKEAGPWSDWYVSDDRNYFWRARQFQDETWDYEFTPGYQEPPQLLVTAPSTSGSDHNSWPLSPSPGKPPDSPNLGHSLGPTSPKSSWPTIITTSTGYPTDDLSASSSRTLTTLPKELDDSSPLGDPSTALVPFAAAATHAVPSRGKPNGTTKRISSTGNSRRQVGPVLCLLQESRSRKGRAKTEMTRSTANITSTAAAAAATTTTTAAQKGDPGRGAGAAAAATSAGAENNGNDGRALPATNRAASAFAKKLHAKVKSEKELKVDPKRRVRAWLKDVEVDWEPIPLDGRGFPIY